MKHLEHAAIFFLLLGVSLATGWAWARAMRDCQEEISPLEDIKRRNER